MVHYKLGNKVLEENEIQRLATHASRMRAVQAVEDRLEPEPVPAESYVSKAALDSIKEYAGGTPQINQGHIHPK